MLKFTRFERIKDADTRVLCVANAKELGPVALAYASACISLKLFDY